MKRKILVAVDFCGVITDDELYEILKGYMENLKRATFKINLERLLKDVSLYELLPNETGLKSTSYVLGPTAELEDDTKFKYYLRDVSPEIRSTKSVEWDRVAKRTKEEFSRAIQSLKEDALGLYKTPRRIENDYFNLAIKYHQIYGFFNEHHTTDFLMAVHDALQECRGIIENLDFT
jgi:hypothetical protein